MNSRATRLLLPYGVAIASTGIALLLTLLLEPLMAQTIGSFFYIAVMLSTWYGGLRPGLVAIVLSLLAINYYFISPLRQFWGTASDDLVRLCIFVIVAFIINLLSDNLRESKRKVEILSQRLQEESGDRLRIALKAAQMGMWDWDLVTGEINWSPEHERLLGLPLGSFDGRYETFDACLHPDDRAGLNQAVTHALQHQVSYHHEFRVIWADGSIHWIEGRGKAFYKANGQPVRMSGTIMAIDERKYVELELQKRERLFSTLAEALPVAIFRFNAASYCIYLNNYWTVMTGRSPESAMGLGWIETLHPDDREHLVNTWMEWSHHAQERGCYTNEGRLVHRDGRNIQYYIQALPEVDANGEAIGYIGVLVDITQKKQAEIALQQLNTELEQRITERTAELTVTNDRLLETLMEQQHTQLLLLEQAQLLDLAHDTIMTLDLNWVITFWNQGAEKTYGWSKNEALGKESYILLKTQFSQPLDEIQSTVFKQGYWEGELVHFSRDNHSLVVASRWVLQKDLMGRPIKILEINNRVKWRRSHWERPHFPP